MIKNITVAYVLLSVNPFRPEFTIIIFIHYKPRIVDLQWMKMRLDVV